MPTLLLWGEDDRRSPTRVAEQLHADIPNSELAIIAIAGHLSNMEQQDARSPLLRGARCGLGAA
jgi:pimeloyl-ACP methyl ester carboxylesterase